MVRRVVEVAIKTTGKNKIDQLDRAIDELARKTKNATALMFRLSKAAMSVSLAISKIRTTRIDRLNKSLGVSSGLMLNLSKASVLTSGTTKITQLNTAVDRLGVSATATSSSMLLLSRASNTTTRRVITTDRSIDNLNTNVKKTTGSIGTLSKVAIGVGLALAAIQVKNYADTFTSVQNQIRQTVKTTEELTKRTEQLLDIANRSRAGLTDVANSYTQITLATENLGLSTERTLRLIETISKSFTLSGKTAAEAAQTSRQLNQAFSSGVLRGQEYNSIIENAPELFRALQRSLGKTAGELRKMADTGQISSEVLISAILKATTIIDRKFNASTKTMAQNLEIANNNMIEFVGSSTSVQNVVAGAGSAIVTASENLDTLLDVTILLSAIFVARLIPGMVAYTSASVANTTAQIVQVKAVTGVSAALGVQSAVLTRATVATNIMTVASRLLGTSLSFLGGPLGVILIAATALAIFISDAEDAEKQSRDLANEVERLTESFKGLTNLQRKIKLEKINAEMALVRAELVRASESLNKFRGFADSPIKTQSIRNYESQIKLLNSQLDILSAKQGALFVSGLPELTPVKNITTEPDDEEVKTSAFSKKLEQETEQLRLELALRQAVTDSFVSTNEADEILAFTSRAVRSQSAFDTEFAKLGTDEQAKMNLTAQFREQQLLLVQEFQANLTDVELLESEERIQQARKEANEKAAINNQIIGAAVNLGAALLKNSISSNAKSEKEKKKARKKAVIIDTAAGISLAFATNPFPVAVGIAAIISGIGISNLAAINSASSIPNQFGGDGGGVSSPGINAPTQTELTTVNTIESTALTELNNELRNLDPDEVLPVSFVRRIIAGVTEATSSGQA